MSHAEQWRPIPGYEGLYEASAQGQVRSVPHTTVDVIGRSRSFPGTALAQALNAQGRLTVVLSKNGEARTRLVHHLVLEAFVGPRPEGLECCHGDDNPSNNALANLRWDTQSENARDRVRNGIHHYSMRTHCKHGHEYSPENTRIRQISPGRSGRVCRACARRRKAEWEARQ